MRLYLIALYKDFQEAHFEQYTCQDIHLLYLHIFPVAV